ncbi:MAG: hypothetical protein K0S32_4322, partial [Bacteroidetes bacterium]|nr:hypothetical protein [Bacteroidota bacterium]
MKKLCITFIIFNLALFTSCKKSDPVTEELALFLNSKFQLAPQNNHVYLFVPSTQCHNCILLSAQNLSEELKEKLHIVTSLNQKHFSGFKNFHRDKSDDVSALKFLGYENKFVFYNNNQVEAIVKANIGLLNNEV